GVEPQIRARGHRVRQWRADVARLEEGLRVGTGGRADVSALRVDEHEQADAAGVVADLLQRAKSVAAERLEERRLRLDGDDVDDPPAEARHGRRSRRSTEHGLAAQLHREEVETRVEADDELALLPSD